MNQSSDFTDTPFLPRKDVEIVAVIRTRLTVRGKGTPESRVRRVDQFWSLDGRLLAEVDPDYDVKHDEMENDLRQIEDILNAACIGRSAVAGVMEMARNAAHYREAIDSFLAAHPATANWKGGAFLQAARGLPAYRRFLDDPNVETGPR